MLLSDSVEDAISLLESVVWHPAWVLAWRRAWLQGGTRAIRVGCWLDAQGGWIPGHGLWPTATKCNYVIILCRPYVCTLPIDHTWNTVANFGLLIVNMLVYMICTCTCLCPYGVIDWIHVHRYLWFILSYLRKSVLNFGCSTHYYAVILVNYLYSGSYAARTCSSRGQ